MTKEPEGNDKIAQDRARSPNPGEKPNPQNLQGKALQMNDNSVEDGEPARPATTPRRGSADKPTPQTGKALQMNDNSVDGD